MKEHERTWKNMKENKKKMKENEEKWKIGKKQKWKKWEKKVKNEKKWKNEKNGEKWWKKKENEKNWIQTQKSSTIFKVYRCCGNFFRQNPRRFPWFCFGMCLFPEENQQPVLGGHRFSEEKWQFSLDVKQKHTFYRRKIGEKKNR